MAAIAFDTLLFARRLKDAGVPEKQAEAQAEVMAETFVYNMDSLVTTDYLDARLAEQNTRLDARFVEFEARVDNRFVEFEARVDTRFAEFEARFNSRFGDLESSTDKRFTEQDAKFEKRFAAIDVRFTELKGELGLQRWILAAIAASTVLPALNSIFNWA